MMQKVVNELHGIYSIISSSRPKIESFLYVLRSIPAFLLKRHKIKYLGNDFYYTDKNTPLLLQWYPEEIETLLSKTGRIKTCLDIGGNIGQFSYTLKKYIPDVEIVSVEPQKDAIRYLKKNTGFKVIEACIGKGRKKVLYVEEGKNDRSSPVEGVNRGANRKIEVDAIELTEKACKKLGIKTNYDLIKIDVEGAEKEVLTCIKDLNWKYLQVESTAKDIIEVEKLIRKYWDNVSLVSGKDVTTNSVVKNYVYKRK